MARHQQSKMKHNETLRDGYLEQKVRGSTPFGCAIECQALMVNLSEKDRVSFATCLPLLRRKLACI
jgi:hypothetical protein